jgi:hypothetical protein
MMRTKPEDACTVVDQRSFRDLLVSDIGFCDRPKRAQPRRLLKERCEHVPAAGGSSCPTASRGSLVISHRTAVPAAATCIVSLPPAASHQN